MEVANDGDAHAELVERFNDARNGLGRIFRVHRDAHQLGPGLGQSHHLIDGRRRVRRIGVGHRLDDDRRAAADGYVADLNSVRFVPFVQKALLCWFKGELYREKR